MYAASDLWQRLAASGPGVPGSDDALVSARRELVLYGLPYELCLIPGRSQRRDIPGRERPAFRSNPGPRIRRDEAFWCGEGLVATPNRYPFFWPQLLLWPEAGLAREPEEAFLGASFRLADELGATVLCNTIGASASIPLSHAHLLERPSRVLEALPLVEVLASDEARILAIDLDEEPPFFVAVVDAPVAAERARLTAILLRVRRSAAINLVACGTRCFVVPRRLELAAPEFPFAIGCGELFGRFVYPDRSSFEAATATDLEHALARALVGNTPTEHRGLADALADAL